MKLEAQSHTEELLARISELEAALGRQERIAAALSEVGAAVGGTVDLDRLLELILERITDLLEAQRSTLYLLDESSKELVSRMAVGDEIRSVRMKVGHGIAGTVARTGKTVRVRDAYRDKRFIRDWDELLGYRTQSMLAAPLKNHVGKIIGVVQVVNKNGRKEFTAQDEALLVTLATQAAISIDHSRLFLSVTQKNMQLLETTEKLEQSVLHLRLLFELESTMNRAATLEDLVREVLRKVVLLSDAETGSVLLVDHAAEVVELFLWDRASPGVVHRETVRAGNLPGAACASILSQAVQHARPVRARLPTSARRCKARGGGARDAASVAASTSASVAASALPSASATSSAELTHDFLHAELPTSSLRWGSDGGVALAGGAAAAPTLASAANDERLRAPVPSPGSAPRDLGSPRGPVAARDLAAKANRKARVVAARRGRDAAVAVRTKPADATVAAVAVPLDGEDTPMGALGLCGARVEGLGDSDIELLRLIAANFSTALRLFRSRLRREREERLTTIGSLLSSIVHDLKGPMAVIHGCVDVMARTDDPTERERYASMIASQLELSSAMQREVLEFARGERRVFVRKVYLAPFFEELASQLRRELDPGKVALELELADRSTARFDQGKITRVIHNLARNAVEAMGTNGGTLSIRVRRSKDGELPHRNALVIEVADTGPGIPKEIEARLFQSFVTAGKKGGTGLGLAIVKKIVEEHEGTISVQSASTGTTFTIVMPQPASKS